MWKTLKNINNTDNNSDNVISKNLNSNTLTIHNENETVNTFNDNFHLFAKTTYSSIKNVLGTNDLVILSIIDALKIVNHLV